MALIDASYFTGELDIPNTGEPAVLADLNRAIEQFEYEVLVDLLGYRLYKQFIDGLDQPAPEQKWKDLRDGAEFSFEFCDVTVTTKWEGLVNQAKRSLIAYYVFYKKLNIDMVSAAGVGGVVQTLTENAEMVSPVNVLVRTWNKMLRLYGDIDDRDQNQYYFGGFNKYSSADYVHFNDKPSAYNFLLARKQDYPDWVFSPKKAINSFGL